MRDNPNRPAPSPSAPGDRGSDMSIRSEPFGALDWRVGATRSERASNGSLTTEIGGAAEFEVLVEVPGAGALVVDPPGDRTRLDRRPRRRATRSSARRRDSHRTDERGAMPVQGPQNRHRDRQVGDGEERGPDSQELAQTGPSVSPVPAQPPATEVPERRCWRCLLMFPGDRSRAPTRTPGWWLCNPCDHALLGAELRET